MTRSDETVVYQQEAGKTRKQQDMASRMDVIEQARAQLVVSIHMNRYSDSGVRGAQVFYFEEGSDGQLLAQTLQQSLNALEEQVKKRNAATGNYFILKTPQCPSALVECGFLSNPQEEALLQDARLSAAPGSGAVPGHCDLSSAATGRRLALAKQFGGRPYVANTSPFYGTAA